MKNLLNFWIAIAGLLFSTVANTFALAILDTVVTFEGEDAGFFLKPVTENPLITDLGMEIIDGALVDQWIYLNTEVDKITKAYTGCGAKNDTELGAAINRKPISPVKLEIFKTQCADVFDNTVFRKNVPAGVEAGNLTGGEILKFLIQFLDPVITRDALRIMLLGDTALADGNYSMLDGWFKVFSGGVVTDGISDAGAITDANLLVANILTTLKRVKDARHRKLKQQPKKDQAIFVTDTVYEAWQEYLQTNAALESNREKLISGIDVQTYQGVQMIPLSIIDDYLEADFSVGSPAVITGEHRIVWCRKDNNVLAIDTVANYNQIKFGYNDETDINWFKARYQMDFDYKYPELVTVAGF